MSCNLFIKTMIILCNTFIKITIIGMRRNLVINKIINNKLIIFSIILLRLKDINYIDKLILRNVSFILIFMFKKFRLQIINDMSDLSNTITKVIYIYFLDLGEIIIYSYKIL